MPTPPDVGVFDAPVTCLIVNQEWAAHIRGMLRSAEREPNFYWDTDQEVGAQGMERIQEALALGNCAPESAVKIFNIELHKNAGTDGGDRGLAEVLQFTRIDVPYVPSPFLNDFRYLIQLTPGWWHVAGWQIVRMADVGQCQLILKHDLDSTITEYWGLSHEVPADTNTPVLISKIFEFAEGATVWLEQVSSRTDSANGYGEAANVGDEEIYAQFTFTLVTPLE